MSEALKKITGTMVAFGDVVQLSKERSQDPEADGFERYIGLEHLEPSDLKVRNWGDISDGVTFTSVFRPGQVLFGKRRAYQRKVAVADFSGVCSGDIYVLEPKGDQLLPELLPFICQSEPFYDYVISMSQGGLSPRVNWKALAKYEFVLPSLEEQRRVALALRASLQAHDSLLTAAIKFSDVCDAKLQTLFSGASRGPLSKLAERVTKGTTPTTLGYDYVQDEIPFLRAEDVLNREVDLASCEKHIGIVAHQALARSHILPNDVLLTIAGTVGRAGLVPTGIGEANCNQAVAIIRPSDPRDARFLFTWLMSREAHNQMLGGKVTGTISNLSLTNIKNLKVPLLRAEERDQVSSEFEALVNKGRSIEGRAAEVRRIQSEILNRSLLGGVDQ